MGIREYKGGAVASTLSGSITNVATTCVLASATGWPTGSFYAVIDPGLASEEKVLVTSRSGTTLTFTTRGADDTSASAHSSGAVIRPTIAAVDLAEPNAHLNAVSGVHGFANFGSFGGYGIPSGDCSLGTTKLLVANQIYYMPFVVFNSVTVTELMVYIATGGTAGAKNRLSIYKANTDGTPGALVLDAGEIAVSTTGAKLITGLSQTLTSGLYLLRVHTDGSATQPTYGFWTGGLFFGGAAYFQSAASGYIAQADFTQNAGRTYAVAETPGQSVAPTLGATVDSWSGYIRYYVQMKWTA